MATLNSWNGEGDRDDIDPMAWVSMDCAKGFHQDCHMDACECGCHEAEDEPNA